MLYRYLHRKELQQYEAADLIGVETPGNFTYFRDELAHKNFPLEVMLNWMEPGDVITRGTLWRKKLGLEAKTVFFYGGNIGVAQDMDNIVRLASGLSSCEEIFFLLVGSGSEVDRLNQEIKNRRLSNIRIMEPVPQEQYIDCLAEFDVGLVSLERRLKTHSLTGKLMGYMRCGMPILASLNPGNDLAQFLTENEAGIAVLNGDDESFRNAALLLANNPDLRDRMGMKARQLGEQKFSVQAAASQILTRFENPQSRGMHYSHGKKRYTNA
jgi:glycosyltransferase involved in cell wall biosynthesis